MTEDDFQQQVTDLADLYGWDWVHHRPAQTSKGWRTPVSGTMGKGWPDLVLVRTRADHRRLLWVELKTAGGKVDPAQVAVLSVLRHLEGLWLAPTGDDSLQVQVCIWRPADVDDIVRTLA